MKRLSTHQRALLIEQVARSMSWEAEPTKGRYRERARALVDDLEAMGVEHICIAKAVEKVVPLHDDEAVA